MEQVAELSSCCLDGSGFGFPDQMLEFGEELLDRVEARAGRGDGSCLPHGAAAGLALVAAEVEDDDIAFGEGGNEDPLDIEAEEHSM